LPAWSDTNSESRRVSSRSSPSADEYPELTVSVLIRQTVLASEKAFIALYYCTIMHDAPNKQKRWATLTGFF